MTQLTVKKSHELVTARYSFNLMEMRLFTLIISMIPVSYTHLDVYKRQSDDR